MDINLADFYVRLGGIAIIVLLGFILGKKKLIDHNTNSHLVNLLLMVFMPAALFSAFPIEYSESAMGMFLSGLAGGTIVMFVLLFASKLIFNKCFYKRGLRYESQFAFIFNNATFLGYPIISSTFGEQGLIPYAGFIIAFNLALFSYGVFLFERKLSWRLIKDTLLNPNIIAVALGVVFFLTSVKLPEFVGGAIEMTASATTPLSLICIGFMLSHAEFKKLIKKWRLFVTAAIQLIIGPGLTLLVLSVLNFPREVVVVCSLIQALPTATSLALFAEKYKGNTIESSELVAISTIMSAITLPIMASIIVS